MCPERVVVSSVAGPVGLHGIKQGVFAGVCQLLSDAGVLTARV